jgi:hypothetical protein
METEVIEILRERPETFEEFEQDGEAWFRLRPHN